LPIPFHECLKIEDSEFFLFLFLVFVLVLDLELVLF
jgi:hypothetical protein